MSKHADSKRYFKDRVQAGNLLAAQLLEAYGGREDVVVLALPRGGVPVAYQVAKRLRAPLDVLLVRKLGVPGHEELAMGAVADDNVLLLQGDLIKHLGVPADAVEALMKHERDVIRQREQLYRHGMPPPNVAGKVAIVIDDGMATGMTMLVAVRLLRQWRPARVVVAVPVCSRETCRRLRAEADDVLCLHVPDPFFSVGTWYRNFDQLSDAEVVRLLRGGRPPAGEVHGGPGEWPKVSAVTTQPVLIPCGAAQLKGMLSLPVKPTGLVLFAHGSGSSYRSTRNNFIASRLHEANLGTLLFDLLTEQEAHTSTARFDIALLTARLSGARDWVREEARCKDLPVGLFGASTGAAAALTLAARADCAIEAVVSRGGRPDLASAAALAGVQCPTLLIVGSLDSDVISMNRTALNLLHCLKRLEIVAGASHLFEEPGTLASAANLAVAWFARFLGAAGGTRRQNTAQHAPEQTAR